MDWYFVCLAPKKALKIKVFPCNVGRNPEGISSVKFDDPSMSRVQFALNSLMGQVYYVNKSPDNPRYSKNGARLRLPPPSCAILMIF